MTNIENVGYLFSQKDCGAIVGAKRSGKTNLLVYMMVLASMLDIKVYSNISLKNVKNFMKLDSKDSIKFLNQLEAIIQNKFKNNDFNPIFIGIDEFPNILHAQLWKEGTRWSKLFDQLGKAGGTTYVTATHFNKIYNGFRETCDRRIIIQPIDDNFFIARFQKQSSIDCELYKTFYKQIYSTHPMRNYYDTHEAMYL